MGKAKTLVLLCSVVAAVGCALSVAPAANAAAPCSKGLRLRLQALTDGTATQLLLTVSPSSAAACAAPTALRRVQVKPLTRAGRVQTRARVRAPAGRATLALRGLKRGQRLKVTVLVRNRILAGTTRVLLLPDLVIARAAAPASVAGGKAFTVTAQVAEVNRAVGATATLTLLNGKSVLASTPVRVQAGRRTAVQLPVTLAAGGSYALTLTLSASSPRETNVANDAASVTVQVIEFQLDPAEVLVPSFAGYGAQFNQHVYAAISAQAGVTPDNVVDMENKVGALQPQLARIFFNTTELTDPDRMQSFVRTVQLAQRSGATIDVVWQGGGGNPATNMSKFADVLVDLVRNRGITNLGWVTAQNEVNTTRITTAQYEATVRLLDGYIRAAGLRSTIRFMGGDLVAATSPLGQSQQSWFDYMGTHMSDVLDAYSIHVFWDYWDPTKLARRLTDARSIVDALPAEGRKPVFIGEYSVRGARTLNGTAYPEPGVYSDGTPIANTNLNAFQHAWLDVLAAKLGYEGAIKWDAYFGKYDNGVQAHYEIGAPQEGWPLRPVYYLTRLFTLTTKPGWQVVGVDGSSGTKLVSGYSGPDGKLTLIGLDTAGASLNAVSATQDSYLIGGLPPGSSFQLYYWNLDGSGQISPPQVVTTDAAGLVTVTAPLQSVFALSTIGL